MKMSKVQTVLFEPNASNVRGASIVEDGTVGILLAPLRYLRLGATSLIT